MPADHPDQRTPVTPEVVLDGTAGVPFDTAAAGAQAQHGPGLTAHRHRPAPAGTAVSDQAVWLGENRNGRNGSTARWRYTEEVPLAHLIVQATGPGGTAEEFYPITNNGGMDPTEEVVEEVTEDQKATEDQNVSDDQKP